MTEASPSLSARYLITVGLPRCDQMGLEHLTQVESDVLRVVDFFTRTQAYDRVLGKEIPLGASAATVRRELSRWFAANNRHYDDTVVIYIAGHGGPAGKGTRHFIFTGDSDPRQPDETAIETGRLGHIFFDGEGVRPQNVLLILDTCYSGKGAGQAAAMVSQAKGDLQDAPASGFWIIASAGPTSGAADGVFMTAFLETIAGDVCSPRGGNEFVDPVTLVVEVNDWFRDHRHPQIAELDTVGGGQKRPIFLRNLNFTRHLDGVELADEGHWNPKARGVDEFSSAGWFFTGRRSALRKLVTWLNARASDGRARVVTGNPGSGKSALLGWLVLCAHKESRELMRQAGVALDPEIAPTEGSIDVAMYARGANLEAMVQQLSTGLNLTTTKLTDILRFLEPRSKNVTIVVDALDESVEPLRIQNEFLLPLSCCRKVRLVAAGRRIGGRAPLAGVAEVIDLDAADYFNADDIALYVVARLMRSVPPTAYAELQTDALRIGHLVAEQADGSFLYARIVSRRIAADPPIDTSAARWEDQLPLPEELSIAFESDLARFPEEQRRRFVDLLLPLAYAKGKGLPQKYIWRILASSVAGKPAERAYTNSDNGFCTRLRWL